VSRFDGLMLALAIAGIALEIILHLLPHEWREKHKASTEVFLDLGFALLGTAFFMLVVLMFPDSWGRTLAPRIVTIVGGALLLGGLLWNFFGINPEKAEAQSQGEPNSPRPTPANNSGIITNNQSGGSNQIINQEVPARSEFIGQPELRKISDKEFEHVYLLNITKLVPRYHFQALGNNILDVSVSQEGGFSTMSNVQKLTFRAPSGVNGFEESFGPAFGRYVVTVKTSDDTAPALADKID
jgi:hypothetical protein